MAWPHTLLAVLVAVAVLCGTHAAELLVEVEFDLSTTQALADGYTPADSINNFLASKDLKWLRYYVNLVSGKSGHVRMRTAHLMFKDANSWAVFQYEHGQRWNALFDHFWVDTRRTLWTAAAVDPAYPKTLRAQGVDGGYVFQLLYSAEDRKENELKAKWSSSQGAFIADLKANPGFLERQAFVAGGFQSEYEHMVQFEFTSLKALTDSMQSKAWQDLFSGLHELMDDYAVNILTPGADEALYWPAAGADKAPEKEL
eukprot:RCo036319